MKKKKRKKKGFCYLPDAAKDEIKEFTSSRMSLLLGYYVFLLFSYYLFIGDYC
jgi:hypothetical protein